MTGIPHGNDQDQVWKAVATEMVRDFVSAREREERRSAAAAPPIAPVIPGNGIMPNLPETLQFLQNMFDDGSDVNSDFVQETPFQRKERELLSEKMAITAELEAYRKTPGLSMVSTAASQPVPVDDPDWEVEPSVPVYSNPLQWWKENEVKFPRISRLAKRILNIPATEAPAERIFSVGGECISKKRGALKDDTASDLIFLHDAHDVVHRYMEPERNAFGGPPAKKPRL